jgi:hypothetical protein
LRSRRRSIGLFFTLIILGLSAHLPATLYSGLTAQGVPAPAAASVSHLPPTSALFAAFLGYNPMQTLLGPVLSDLPHATAAYLTGRSFFPHLISAPFIAGLHKVFDLAAAVCVVAAIASWLCGGKHHYTEPSPATIAVTPAEAPQADQGARLIAAPPPGPGPHAVNRSGPADAGATGPATDESGAASPAANSPSAPDPGV